MSMAGPGTVPGYRQCGVPISGTPVKWHSLGYAFRVARPGAPVYPGTRYPTVNGGYRLSGSPVNGYAYYLVVPMSMAAHTTWPVPVSIWRAMHTTRWVPVSNGGYRLCGVPGISVKWRCIRVHGTRRSMAGIGYPAPPVNGYAYYMPGTHANGILGRYQC